MGAVEPAVKVVGHCLRPPVQPRKHTPTRIRPGTDYELRPATSNKQKFRRQPPALLRPNVGGLDDGPPFLNLSLLLGGEGLWRLFVARPASLTEIFKPLPYRRIG